MLNDIYAYMSIDTYMCVHTHIHIHICTHTQTRTYNPMHSRSDLSQVGLLRIPNRGRMEGSWPQDNTEEPGQPQCMNFWNPVSCRRQSRNNETLGYVCKWFKMTSCPALHHQHYCMKTKGQWCGGFFSSFYKAQITSAVRRIFSLMVVASR